MAAASPIADAPVPVLASAILAAVLVLAFAGCAAPPRVLGAPEGSYTPQHLTVVIDGPTEFVEGASVTPQFFAAESVSPLLGRFFVEPEYANGGGMVAVLSHAYWTQRLRADPGVIGRTMTVNGQKRVIVGVAHQRFQPARAGSLWIPGGAAADRRGP